MQITNFQPLQDLVWVLHPSLCSLVLVAEFTPRLLTLAQTWSEKSKLEFQKTTLVTLV